MADAVDMKISQLDAAVSVADADVFPETSGAVSKKVPASVLKNYMIGTNNISALGDGSVTGAILNVKSASETADSNIAETMAQNGAHNLLYNRTSGSSVVGGLTMTTNGNKSITVGSGTTTSDDAIMLSGSSQAYSSSEQTLKKGAYTASINGGTVPIYLIIKVENDGVHGEQSIVVTGSGTNTFTIDADCRIYAYLYINAGGQTSTGGVLYPMIKRASDPSTTYTPFAMTNEELTEKVSNRGLHIPSSADSFAGAASSMFSAVIPLLTNVGDIADGCLEAINYDYFNFTVVKISSTIYRATINQGTRLVTSVYDNGSITSYKYDGTQI